MTTRLDPPERSVLDRALSILSVFDGHHRTLTLSEISRRCGLPVATAHRIVGKLLEWGALERTAEGKYGIGLWLWKTGTLAPHCSSLARTAHPYLVRLHRQTSAAAVLTIRDGLQGLCLGSVFHDPHRSPTVSSMGGRLPLHATASGLVLLAHASQAVRDEVCAGPLERHTPATITEAAALRRCLAQVRRQGYALGEGMCVTTSSAVAAPVRDGRGVVTAAVAAVAWERDFQPLRLIPAVLATAEALSCHLQTSGQQAVRAGA
ncbi:IclR family transcriptional regulator [Streptomyces sp. NPDC052682]|uniref:IclR family transcriptional regulator n=1 Tax=Streptomyces sp. NPDC052682 TaxID=3154954 RepID=UPI0034237E37